MNDVFEIAWEHLMLAEGGGKYVNHPNDPGGPTRWGVTLKTLRSYRNNDLLQAEDVLILTEAEAKEICYTRYFVPLGLSEVKDAALATMILDQGYNKGVDEMKRAIEGMVVALGWTSVVSYEDAIKTMERNAYLQREFVKMCMKAYINFSRIHDVFLPFLPGWMNRILALFDLCK